MKYLWESPDIVSKIIINGDKKDIKDNLASFFCNNFFQNILSPYSVEQNLLYVIALLLKDEINKLNSESDFDNFLKNTKCGYLLNELRKKSEIITYAKTVVFSLIEKLENNSYIILNLDIYYLENIIEILTQKKALSKDLEIIEDFLFLKDLSGEQKSKELKVNEKKQYLKMFEINNIEGLGIFNSKYLPNLDEDELKQIIQKTKDKNMLDYINKYKEILSSNKDIFSNEHIINIICKMNHSDLIVTLYQINFMKLIEFIDLLIDSLLQNIKIIPMSLKYISKIIFYFIKKIFPSIKTVEINSFLGKFFFINLMIPLFQSPFDIYMNDFVISNKTLDNLYILFDIFSQLILGNLFTKEIYYKPLNRYFIEKMPKLFEFYNHLINVNFPFFIEQFINDKLDEEFEYDYFNSIKENNKILISHRSFCFSLNSLFILINSITNNQDIIFSEKDKNNSKFYKIFKKISGTYYKNLLNQTKITEEKTQNKKIEKLFLFTDLLINPKYEYLFNIENIKPYFYIKELKNISTKEESNKNNIIKSKNYISGLLYNCRDLEPSEFISTKTLDILKEIKLFLKTSEFVIDNSLPYEWYVNSLLDCLILLPENLSKDDFYLFYKEIKRDINNSIKILDFYKITDCFGKIKYIKNSIDFLNKGKNNIKDISLNEKTKYLIENSYFGVLIIYNKITSTIKIIKNKQPLNKDKNLNIIKCNSLNSFIRKIPNIKSLKKINDFSIPKELTSYLDEYTKYVVNNSDISFSKEETTIIKQKIYDYTFEKLYSKIYPISPTNKDNKITINCAKLAWTEPKNFFGNKKNNNYNIFMDDLKQLFNKLQKEKSPRLKFEFISDIFKTIIKIEDFNVEKSGADDLLNILVYIFIQVRPKFIDSDIQYIELFKNILDKDSDMETKIVYMKSACNIITNITSNNLIGVTEEEFKIKFNNISK